MKSKKSFGDTGTPKTFVHNDNLNKKKIFFFLVGPPNFFFGASKMAKNRKNDTSPLKGTPPVTKGRGSRFPATSQVRKLIFPDV